MVTATRLKLVDPTVAPSAERGRQAARLATLDGAVIGLYHNSKLNAARLLDLVAEQLSGRFAIRGYVRGLYSPSRLMRSEEWSGVDGCHAVLLTNGD